jgi:hypothetical protein
MMNCLVVRKRVDQARRTTLSLAIRLRVSVAQDGKLLMCFFNLVSVDTYRYFRMSSFVYWKNAATVLIKTG